MSSERTAFNQGEYDEAYPAGVERTYWHLARNHILEAQIRAAGGTRVLDVGCGRGILVEYLNHRGLNCYGVELADIAVPAHLRPLIFTGLPAEALSLDFRSSIDTIVLGDVIEHLVDPVIFLQELLRAFPRLRALVIAVPARSELWSNYDEHYGHYRRYDLPTLRRTVQAAGMAAIELRYMFRLLYPLARLLLRLRGSREVKFKEAGKWGFFHKLGAMLLKADFALLPAGIYGTSALCRAVVSNSYNEIELTDRGNTSR